MDITKIEGKIYNEHECVFKDEVFPFIKSLTVSFYTNNTTINIAQIKNTEQTCEQDTIPTCKT